MRDDRERLLDILEAIERIQKYARRGRDAFDQDELIQVWVVHHLQILGEAVQRLSPELREKQPQIPWRGIVGMRNIVVHEYFAIDHQIVWATVAKDLTALAEGVHQTS